MKSRNARLELWRPLTMSKIKTIMSDLPIVFPNYCTKGHKSVPPMFPPPPCPKRHIWADFRFEKQAALWLVMVNTYLHACNARSFFILFSDQSWKRLDIELWKQGLIIWHMSSTFLDLLEINFHVFQVTKWFFRINSSPGRSWDTFRKEVGSDLWNILGVWC